MINKTGKKCEFVSVMVFIGAFFNAEDAEFPTSRFLKALKTESETSGCDFASLRSLR
jgi:hypothetical protein